jgi:glycosyltransferase involved in cell wall biosynthesis
LDDGAAVPSINVVIPVWNRAHVIERAIASIVSQELPAADWSVQAIVVDDGSTDNLAGALRRFGAQVTCIRHEHNVGAAAARNTAILAAKGDYLAFLDSDDIWLPNKLTKQIAFMRSNAYPISCTACRLARPGGPSIVWPRYKTGRLTLADIAWGCILSPGTTMICEPRIFAEIGLFDTGLQRHEDWDWLLRLTARYDLAYLAEPLAYREPSAFGNHPQALDAIDKIREKHLSHLPLPVRRSFAAGLAFETAAARYRQGNRGAAASAMLKSIWLAPIGHAALGAIVAGRLARH